MINFEHPLQQAWTRTRAALFRNFRAGVWLRLGLVAWLTTFLNGGGTFPDDLLTRGKSPEKMLSMMEGSIDWLLSLGPFRLIALLCGTIFVVGVFLIFLLWLGCRGQFLLIDNMRRNASAVVEPWRRLRAQANDFFRVYMWVVSVPAIVAFLAFLGAYAEFYSNIVNLRMPQASQLTPWLVFVFAWFLFGVIWGIGMFFYREFGIPIMIASGCGAEDALWRVWDVLRFRPVEVLVYGLVRLGMGILVKVITVAAIYVTCLAGSFPYVGTLLTLPVFLFRQSFVLDCLAQLTSDHRFWPEEPPPLGDLLPE